VEVRRWGDCRERRNNSCALHSGAPDQHHILLVHINRDNVVEAEARATLVREWLADAFSGEVRTHPGTIKAPSSLIYLEEVKHIYRADVWGLAQAHALPNLQQHAMSGRLTDAVNNMSGAFP
jgi:hypothetical protein